MLRASSCSSCSSYARPMNEGHGQFCASDEWRAAIRNTILPPSWGAPISEPTSWRSDPGTAPRPTSSASGRRSVTAVEIHPELAAGLRERFAGTNVDVVEGDATNLTFDDDRFERGDLVLHAPPRPVAAAAGQALRRGRPGAPPGRGCSSPPTASPATASREFHHDDDYVPVDPTGLADRLAGAGLVDVEISVYKDQGWNVTARKPTS